MIRAATARIPDIALHNAYGIGLNATGVELAEVPLRLNTMHPGMRAPCSGCTCCAATR
ncbi:hypothetical protein [Streptomyces sp. NPDC088760]|uniref:hypothetical protein n=1 Tax=Streptomyces sp. NPDC088760 TaxID=3365890 RepID=UPI003812C277